MPIVTIDLWSGRTREQKELLAEAITQSMVEILHVKPQAIQIVYNNIEKCDWAINGKLQDEV